MFILNKKLTVTLSIFASIFVGLLIYLIIISLNQHSINLINGCDEGHASFIKYQVNDKQRKISYCDQHNGNIMTIKSEYTDRKNYIVFDYIGNPNGPDTSIYLEDKYQNRYVVPDLKVRGYGWSTKIIKVPDYLKEKIRVVGLDNSQKVNGWLGIGNIITLDRSEDFKILAYVKTIFYIFLFSIFISAIFTYFLKYKNPLVAYIYMSMFVGLCSLLLFYAYLFSIQSGQILSIALFLFALFNLFRLDASTLKMSLAIFTFLSSMMMIILFLAYSDLGNLLNLQSVSAHRWVGGLATDNWIPKFFADAVLRENIPSPLFGSWLSSDRPPLQTGFFLLFTLFSSTDLMYLVTSVGMQLLVLIFVLMLLNNYVRDKSFIILIMILIFFNGFVFVNSLFVWPKLLSALYQGIAFYYLYTIWISKRRTKKDFIFFGLSSSLAFLSHGGSIFYLLSLSILLLFTLRVKSDIGKLLYGLLIAVIIYLPWIAYQKLIDPPGDRLLKWHLAGQIAVTDKSFWEVLTKYYEKMTLSDWASLQISHMKGIFHSFYLDLVNLSTLSRNHFLDNNLLSMNYSYLFFTILLVVLYWFSKNKMSEIKTFVLLALGSYLIYIIVWSVLLSSETIIPHGSYFGWFSGFLPATLITYYTNKYLFYVLGFLNLLVFITIYLEPYLFHQDIISSSIVILAISTFILTLYQLVQEDRGLE